MKNRTHVAQFAADAIRTGSTSRSDLVAMLAAWLIDTKSTRQAEYLVQDIAKKLANEGYIFISVTSAHPLSAETKQAILSYVQQYFAQSVHVEMAEVLDPGVIGGVQIDTPYGSLDATVKRKLIQIVKGVQR